MKKENYQIIAEILLNLEGRAYMLEGILEELDVSDECYKEAKQDFNKYGKSLRKQNGNKRKKE